MSVSKEFILAGDAIFTIDTPDMGHRTYRVQHVEKNDRWPESWFVRLLTGPDNSSQRKYKNAKTNDSLPQMQEAEIPKGSPMLGMPISQTDERENLQRMQNNATDCTLPNEKRKTQIAMQQLRQSGLSKKTSRESGTEKEAPCESHCMDGKAPREAGTNPLRSTVPQSRHQGGIRNQHDFQTEKSREAQVCNLPETPNPESHDCRRSQPLHGKISGIPLQDMQQRNRLSEGRPSLASEGFGISGESFATILETGTWSYLGKLDPFTGQITLTAKSHAKADSYVVRLLNKTLARIWCNDHAAYEQHGFRTHHEGRCGKCGRRLTTPESVERGIGPDCFEQMGGAKRPCMVEITNDTIYASIMRPTPLGCQSNWTGD